MNARPVTVVLAFAFGAHCSAVATVLDSLMSGDVRVATQLREIDTGALTALERQFRDEHRLADRGAPFQSTDVVMGAGPPKRRLVLAAVSGDTWFIHYEHGGIGLHSHLVALARSDRTWRVVYSVSTFYSYNTLPKLRDAIRAHQFREQNYEF